MIDALICGLNIFCHVSNLQDRIKESKYPPDVASLCFYFEEQKAELPDYCKWKQEPFVPKKRSEL